MRNRKLYLAALAFALVAGGPASGWAKDAVVKEAVEAVVIDGYRSAHFGMTEKEVRSAAKKDFDVSELTAGTNDTERTKVLSLTAKNLLPDAPPAMVSYILGATSAKLIQVNVVWGAEAGGTDLHQLASVANALRTYFLGRGAYVDGSMAVNQTLPDGSILVFRGAEAKGHMVVLHLQPLPEPSAAGTKDKPAEAKNGMLRLSYVENPAKPDIFHIEKGQF